MKFSKYKQKRSFIVSILLIAVVFSFAGRSDISRAFDLDMSPDSGMTAEDSRKIYEQRKNHPELYPTRSPKPEVSKTPVPIHPDKVSADHREKREQESKFASIAIPIASIIIFISFAILAIYLTRKQSRTKPNKKRRKR